MKISKYCVGRVVLLCSLILGSFLFGQQPSVPNQNSAGPNMLSFTLGDHQRTYSGSSTNLGSLAGAQDAAIQRQLQLARDAYVDGIAANSAQIMLNQLRSLPKGGQGAGIDPQHIKLIEQLVTTSVARERSVPLAKVFPTLAHGIRTQNLDEILVGLDEFGQALVQANKRPFGSERPEDQLKGIIVNGDGLLLGLPDAPAPVRLISEWGTPVGVKVRKSLNELMVAKQVVDGEFRNSCEGNATADCEKRLAAVERFHTRYYDLALVHGIADRLGVAGNPFFGNLMGSLEKTSDFILGASYSVGENLEDTLKFVEKIYSAPVKTTKELIGGLGNALYNYDQTYAALKKSVGEGVEKLLYGTAEEQGYIVGSLGSEVLTYLFPPLKTGSVTKRLGIADNIAKSLVEQVPIGESLHLVRDATEKAATTIAVLEKTNALEASGKITSTFARDLEAVAKTFPRAANEILDNPKLHSQVAGLRETVSRSKPVELLHDSLTDRQVSSLLRAEGEVGVQYLRKEGFDAAAGAAKVEELIPGTFKKYAEQGRTEALGRLSRGVTETLEITRGSLENKSFQTLLEVEEVWAKNGIKLSEHAPEWLASRAGYSSLLQETAFTADDFARIGSSYTKLENSIKSIKGVPSEGTMYRGIKEHLERYDGVVVKRKPEEIFEMNAYNMWDSHRYSGPGQYAQYGTVVADEKAARLIIPDEIKAKGGQSVLYDSTHYKLKNALNLMDEKTLEKLGVEMRDLIREKNYEVTQQLGDLARRHGFDGIIAPSHVDSSVPNIILLAD